jgi:Fe-S-cluster containining protein
MFDPPWYAEGLRFGCTRCGGCCVGAGTVRVSDEEIAALAVHLGIGNAEFRAGYTRSLRGGEVSLREKPDEACIFYDSGSGCGVYEHRPRQCRSWPFWRAVVHSRERWDEESRDCPGMNQGERRAADDITRTATDDGTSGVIPIRRGRS